MPVDPVQSGKDVNHAQAYWLVTCIGPGPHLVRLLTKVICLFIDGPVCHKPSQVGQRGHRYHKLNGVFLG